MEAFEWERIWKGADYPWLFIAEIALRTLIMYVVMMLFFRITGKKEIKQLSIFDLIIIIGLGSAAGDPMFNAHVPVTHGIAVFVVILIIYHVINSILWKSHKANEILEGKSVCVFSDNLIRLETLKKEDITTEELFSELRQENISHLGQIDRVYLEFSGEFSIFFREDDDVVPGLCIFPESLEASGSSIPAPGLYSCVQCGHTGHHEHTSEKHTCTNCRNTRFSLSSDRKRIT